MSKLIKTVQQLNKSLPDPKYDGSWMSDEPNVAFLVSVGAGPWKEKRRYNVQKAAIDWFYGCGFKDMRDVSSFTHWEEEKVYPFKWQNDFLFNMGHSLKKSSDLFEALCLEWKVSKDWEKSLKDLFDRCGTKPDGAKVLWMFARDFLGIPSFPIDRWIDRTLVHYNLPRSSWYMTKLCIEAEVDPNILNRKIFGGTNPDWSKS